MGIFDYIRASDNTERNRNAAVEKVAKAKAKIISDLSQYGDVIELKDHERLGWIGGHGLRTALDYNSYYLHEEYGAYSVQSESYSYVSSFSGKVDSAGNVSDLTPNYSSGSYSYIEKHNETHGEDFYLKVIKRGSKGKVEELEKQFLADEGDLYLRIKGADRFNPDERKSNLLNVISAHKKFAVASLICTIIYSFFMIICGKAVFSGEITKDNDDALLLPRIVALALVVIFIVYVVYAVKLHKAKKKPMYDLKDRMSTTYIALSVIYGLVCLLVTATVSALGLEFISWIFDALLLVFSIGFLVRCFAKDKNKNTHLYCLMNNYDKMNKLENLAAEIRSYSMQNVSYYNKD